MSKRVAWLVVDDAGWPCPNWKPAGLTTDPAKIRAMLAEAPGVVEVTYQWPPTKKRSKPKVR